MEKDVGKILRGKERQGEKSGLNDDGFVEPSEELFHDDNRLESETGTEWDIPEFDVLLRRFAKCQCVVVCGTSPSHVQWAATRLALNSGFLGCYHSTRIATLNLGLGDIVERLARRVDHTCLVLNYFTTRDGQAFERSTEHLREALKSRPEKFGLIFYLRDSNVAAVRKSLPDNIEVLEVPGNHSAFGSEIEVVQPEDFYRRLFQTSSPTLSGVIAAEPEGYLPRMLVRLAVLFPDLPVAYFEALLRPVLAARNTPLLTQPKEGEKAGVEYRASEIWAAGKMAFEQQAGLRRTTAETSPRMSFASPALATAAAQWAWQDPEAMFEVFAAISQQNILFDDQSESGDRELFDSYISAAAQLARRTPITFGNRWLTSLYLEYQVWVRQRVGSDIPEKADLVSLLQAIAQSAEKRKLWRHFTRRFGVLARCLMLEGSAALVERFLDQLGRMGLSTLATGIVHELALVLGARRFDRLKRLINEGGRDVLDSVVWRLAHEVCDDPGNGVLLWEAMAEWIPKPSAKINSLSEEAAIALPAAILDLLEIRYGQKEAPSTVLPECLAQRLQVPGKEGEYSVLDVWKEIFDRTEFGAMAVNQTFDSETVGKIPPLERRALGVSRTLFQMRATAPDETRENAAACARIALKRENSTGRILIREWWQHFADLWAGAREDASHDRAPLARQHHYLRNYRICLELKRLSH